MGLDQKAVRRRENLQRHLLNLRNKVVSSNRVELHHIVPHQTKCST